MICLGACANELAESTTSEGTFTSSSSSPTELSSVEQELVAEREFCAGEGCAIRLTLSMDGSTKKYAFTNGVKTDEGQWHADFGTAGTTLVNLVEVAAEGRKVRAFAVKESQCSPGGPHVASLQVQYQSTILHPASLGTCELLK